MELLEKLGAAVAQPMMMRACLNKAGLIELSPHQLVVMYKWICMYDICKLLGVLLTPHCPTGREDFTSLLNLR